MVLRHRDARHGGAAGSAHRGGPGGLGRRSRLPRRHRGDGHRRPARSVAHARVPPPGAAAHPVQRGARRPAPPLRRRRRRVHARVSVLVRGVAAVGRPVRRQRAGDGDRHSLQHRRPPRALAFGRRPGAAGSALRGGRCALRPEPRAHVARPRRGPMDRPVRPAGPARDPHGRQSPGRRRSLRGVAGLDLPAEHAGPSRPGRIPDGGPPMTNLTPAAPDGPVGLLEPPVVVESHAGSTAAVPGADGSSWPPGPRRGRLGRFLRGKESDAAWVRPALLALLVGTAVLYLWDLGANGWANSFYSAAVQAGSKSWKAFFFGSSDASNFITVDKPPASLWPMEVSARIFGVHSWSILAPQALEGVATVGLVYLSVRRWFSAQAALLGGAVVALTPVAALMFRYNNP